MSKFPENHQVTIVVPLKDRSDETETFMIHSVFPEFKYLILDGSSDSQNELIVERHGRDNVEYLRLEPDLSIETYVRKMASGLKLVRTPYAMMADNDDVILDQGVLAAVRALDVSPRSSFSGGDIVGFLRSTRDRARVTWPKTNVRTSRIDGMHGLEGVNASRLDWRYLWYSIFRTDVLSWCWSLILESPVRDPYLMEFLLCDLPFCRGTYTYTHVPQYMRLQNQTDRAIATLGYVSVETGRQPKSWWAESDVSDEILAAQLGVDASRLDSQFHRAVAVTGMRGSPTTAKRRIEDLAVRVSDHMPWLSLERAVSLASSGRYRSIPLSDFSGRP